MPYSRCACIRAGGKPDGCSDDAIAAWVALLIIVNVPVPALGAVWSAIVVGVTVFCLVASVDLLCTGQCLPVPTLSAAVLRISVRQRRLHRPASRP